MAAVLRQRLSFEEEPVTSSLGAATAGDEGPRAGAPLSTPPPQAATPRGAPEAAGPLCPPRAPAAAPQMAAGAQTPTAARARSCTARGGEPQERYAAEVN